MRESSGLRTEGANRQPRVSIIVPVLNEAEIIQHAIKALCAVSGCYEVIIVDGGSKDGTLKLVSDSIADLPAFRLISSPPGRGTQLNAGAATARGNALLFLHADTRLPESAVASIQHALQDAAIVGGNFRLQFDGPGVSSAIFTKLNSIRRWFGIYYGDSAIWCRRHVFHNLGGYTNAQLMEDYDLCRRLERAGPTVCLAEPVVSSARRWRDRGIIKTLMFWVLIQWLYLLGFNPVCLARLYYPKRS